MATATIVSLGEYLQTSYRPDREYVDGELRKRHVGKWDHARVQSLLVRFIGNHEAKWRVISSTEQRIQVSATRVRIPDLVVLEEGYPPEVLIDPPLLVIEVLSPDDTYFDIQDRSLDYLNMGVPVVWLVDPKSRTARICLEERWLAATILTVPGTAIAVDIAEIFAQLDRTRRPPLV